MFKLDLEKAGEPEIKLPKSIGLSKKQESSRKQKQKLFCIIDYTKTFDSVDHTNRVKFFKKWEYQSTLPASWEMFIVDQEAIELDME